MPLSEDMRAVLELGLQGVASEGFIVVGMYGNGQEVHTFTSGDFSRAKLVNIMEAWLEGLRDNSIPAVPEHASRIHEA